ncbi:MAG: ribonuclease HII [bacterium]|nr:ribonuclease HII [bacterium]
MNSTSFLQLGIDEAGRGPLAGPVAVAVVGIKDEAIVEALFPDGIKDSKKMSEKQRRFVFNSIKRYAKEDRLVFACALISAHSIDEIGIVPSCTAGVGGVLGRITCHVQQEILLDGRLKAPMQYINQTAYDKGDATYPAIALASVVAKCTRDERMVELGRTYPAYGFEVHKGYGTNAHYEALLRHGLCKEHRRTFLKRFLVSKENPHEGSRV